MEIGKGYRLPTWITLIALPAAIAFSWLESATRTFTWQAEVFTGIPVAAMFALAMLNRPKRSDLGAWLAGLRRSLSRSTSTATKSAGLSATLGSSGPEHAPELSSGTFASRLRESLLVWSLWCAAVIVLELAELSYLPRSQHPTLSSIVEPLLAGSRPVHAVAFFAWMWVGWLFSSKW
ncbi:MAG: hypothetical protein ACYDEY_11285 [Acidimicrobiales bacterium]